MGKFADALKGASPASGDTNEPDVAAAVAASDPKLTLLERLGSLLNRPSSGVLALPMAAFTNSMEPIKAASENLEAANMLSTLFSGTPSNPKGIFTGTDVLNAAGVPSLPITYTPERPTEGGLTHLPVPDRYKNLYDPVTVDLKDVAGLALTLATDPLNYVTAGTAPNMPKVAGKTLNPAGVKAIKEMMPAEAARISETLTARGVANNVDDLMTATLSSKSPARTAAERKLAKILETPAGSKFIDKGGLKFAGKSVIPGKAFDVVGRAAGKTVDLIPGVKKTKQVAAGLFNKKPGLAAPVAEAFDDYINKVNYARDETIDKLANTFKLPGGKVIPAPQRTLIRDTLMRVGDKSEALLANKLVEVTGNADEASRITKLIKDYENGIGDPDVPVDLLIKHKEELDRVSDVIKSAKIPQAQLDQLLTEGINTLPPELRGAARSLALKLRQVAKLDTRARILPRTIPNYFPRKYLNIEDDILAKSGYKPGGVFTKTLGGYAKRRKVKTLEDALALQSRGLLLEPEPGIPVAERLLRGVKTRETLKLRQRIADMYGGEIPKLVQRQLDALNAPNGGDSYTRMVLEKFDQGLGVYKSALTQAFPGFHVRNAISNKMLRYLGEGSQTINDTVFGEFEGLRRGKDGLVQTVFGESVPYDVIRKAAAERQVTKGFLSGELGDTLKQEITPKTLTSKVLSYLNPISLGKKVGQYVEDGDRISLFAGYVKNGMDFDAAAAATKKFLFDYNDLSAFEKNVMRRVFPFYTFKRKSIGLFAEQLLKQPGTFSSLGHFKNFLNDHDITADEFKRLPEYLRRKVHIQIGENQYLTGIDLGFENMLNTIDAPSSLVSEMNPMFKLSLEQAFKKDIYRNKSLDEAAKNITDIPEVILEGPLGKLIGAKKQPIPLKYVKEDGKDYQWIATKPEMLNLIRNLPTSRLLGTSAKLGKGTAGEVLSFLTGMGVTEVDPGLVQYFRDKAMQESLQREGIGKTFENFYVPKEQKPLKNEINYERIIRDLPRIK